MKPVVRDFLTGLTVIAGAVGLVAMLFIFGELSELRVKTYEIKVRATTAGGLNEASRVTMNGVRIGKVTATGVVPPPGQGALLTLRLRDDVRVPRASEVVIDKTFVGDASLEFTVPGTLSPAQVADTIRPGETLDAGEPGSLIKQIAGMIEQPLARMGRTADKIDALAERYTTLGDQLVEMTKSRTLAEVDAGAQPNLRTVVARLDSSLAGASAWLNDGELLKRTQGLLDRANAALTDAEKLADAWTKTAATLEQKTGQVAGNVETLTAQAVATLRKTEQAAGDLGRVLDAANTGRGTVGQLMQNPDLYNSIRDAATRLDRTLADFQLLIEKFKNEGVPIKL